VAHGSAGKPGQCGVIGVPVLGPAARGRHHSINGERPAVILAQVHDHSNWRCLV